jgi:hypothetical protein
VLLDREESSDEARIAIACAAYSVGLKRGVTLVSRLLADKNVLVRRKTARFCWMGPERGVIAPLLRAVADEDPDVRWSAVSALGRRCDVAAAPTLRTALGDMDPGVQAAGAEALGVLLDEGAIAALKALTRDDLKCVRKAAALALKKILARPRGSDNRDLTESKAFDGPTRTIPPTSQARCREFESPRPLAICVLPDGGGRSPEATVPGDSGSDSTASPSGNGAPASGGDANPWTPGRKAGSVCQNHPARPLPNWYRTKSGPCGGADVPPRSPRRCWTMNENVIDSWKRPTAVVGKSLSGKPRIMGVESPDGVGGRGHPGNPGVDQWRDVLYPAMENGVSCSGRAS